MAGFMPVPGVVFEVSSIDLSLNGKLLASGQSLGSRDGTNRHGLDDGYLVAHPTNRKWLMILVCFGGLTLLIPLITVFLSTC
jgi:hypothetical protein